MLRRVRLRLLAPLGTPMVSGTLFGHLCWAFLDRRGTDQLAAWLDDMARGHRPPFLLSDAFPADHLPRPLLPPLLPAEDQPAERAAEHKRQRRATMVRRAAFLALRGRPTRESDWLEAVVEPPASLAVQHAHNVIDRLRNSTPETGGLWFVEDDWGFATMPERDVYVDTDLPSEELGELFAEVGAVGFGRDISCGRGAFEVLEVAEDPELAAAPAGGDLRLVSLSRGCLTANMRDARWRRTTHFGKLAARADDGRPWKKPLLLMLPGASFRPADSGPYGALLDRVHHDLPQVRFNAWHLAVAYREAPA